MMDELHNFIKKNRDHWENEVDSGGHCTVPNLSLDVDSLKRFADGDLMFWDESRGRNHNPLLKKIRRFEYAGIDKKKVLCLASGGGQQSAMFALLGADVTVADISQGQLHGVVLAANRTGSSAICFWTCFAG